MNPEDAFHILDSKHRRTLIKVLDLHNQGTETDVRALSKFIVAVEKGSDPAYVRSAEYNPAYTGYIQKHLPKLADAGVIDYDERKKTITVGGPHITQLARIIREVEEAYGNDTDDLL